MPTLQCGYLVTSLPLSSQPVCTHSYRHVLQPHPNNSLQKDPGRLTPHPPICPCTPHSPLLHPLPLTPSAAGHCLLSLSFTALLVWGGRAESLHYCLVLPCLPLPCQPGLTPFTDLKSTICMTQQSGSKGERDGARRGMKTRRQERG